MAREFIGGVTNPNFILAGFQVQEIEAHIDGRNEASVQVLTGVAVLKSLGILPALQHRVSHRGAAYQDARGTPLHPRAHRFPCNPTIGGQNLPDLAHSRSPQLAEALKAPLAATDLIALEANYADGLFESSGACDGVVRAIEGVLAGQATGQPVDANLVRTCLVHVLLPAYLSAYEAALLKAQEKDNPSVPDFRITDPGVVDRLSAHSISMPMTPNRPLTNVEGAADILLMEKDYAAGRVPPNAAPSAINLYAASLVAMVP